MRVCTYVHKYLHEYSYLPGRGSYAEGSKHSSGMRWDGLEITVWHSEFLPFFEWGWLWVDAGGVDSTRIV